MVEELLQVIIEWSPHAEDGHPRLQAVRGDHFQKVSSNGSSDGSSMVSGSPKHVWHHSNACWPTLVFEVFWWSYLMRCLYNSCCVGPCKNLVEEFLQVTFLVVTTCVLHASRINAVGHISRPDHARYLAMLYLAYHLHWSCCGPCKDLVEEFLQVTDPMVITRAMHWCTATSHVLAAQVVSACTRLMYQSWWSA